MEHTERLPTISGYLLVPRSLMSCTPAGHSYTQGRTMTTYKLALLPNVLDQLSLERTAEDALLGSLQ